MSSTLALHWQNSYLFLQDQILFLCIQIFVGRLKEAPVGEVKCLPDGQCDLLCLERSKGHINIVTFNHKCYLCETTVLCRGLWAMLCWNGVSQAFIYYYQQDSVHFWEVQRAVEGWGWLLTHFSLSKTKQLCVSVSASLAMNVNIFLSALSSAQ